MVEHEDAARPLTDPGTDDAPGISWEPGEEDYPFAAISGETALDFFGRWLDDAGYARIERHGTRYIHEADVANVINHITADVGLLRARLDRFGDRIVPAEDYRETIERIENTVLVLGEVLHALREPRA